MAERHVVLFFSLLAEYQGKCHSCIPLNTNFRHRRQPATHAKIVEAWQRHYNTIRLFGSDIFREFLPSSSLKPRLTNVPLKTNCFPTKQEKHTLVT